MATNQQIFEGLAKITDAAKRHAEALRVFGRGAVELTPLLAS